MAASRRGVWAIDIGNNALRALRLGRADEGFEVIGFDYIEHSQMLTMGGLGEEDRQAIIAETLHKFVEANELGKDEVAISVAGHSSFARFTKLPPVEPKRIPQVVQFEAVQQIPFDINEVEWDWQVMENPDSPDTEVGIFAIKNELIGEIMDRFSKENMKVACVQIAPMALYNFITYDRSKVTADDGKATVVLDMGAENTTLVVCSKYGVWQRSIRIGGNTFTEAIADAFKLRFKKAEKLKRTAPMSKYVRQIFTAMKPVFTDLGSEVQRSLGFYTGSGGSGQKGFSKIIALGGGMKLQGVTKYLQQTLGVPVVKPDSFEKLKVAEDISSAKFHKNVSDFGVVYGLALQLLGEGAIEINLLPRRIARTMAWTRKSKYFNIAAGLLLVVAVLGFANVNRAKRQYQTGRTVRIQTDSTISAAQTAARELEEQEQRDAPLEERISKQKELFKYRDIVPLLNQTLMACLPNSTNNPAQKDMYEAFGNGDVSTVVSFAREERKQLFLSHISIVYAPSLAEAGFPDRVVSSAPANTGGYSYTSGARVSSASGAASGFSSSYGASEAEIAAAAEAGFVVMIEGWSSYKDIDQLMDPPGVASDRRKWGLVTRLENLSEVVANTEFELYNKGNIAHFRLDTGQVQPGSPEMPAGIGVRKQVERVSSELLASATGTTATTSYVSGALPERIQIEEVLVDPMTGEEMSMIFDIITQKDLDTDPELTEKHLGKIKYTVFDEPKYIVRDHWFRISAKFIWKGAAEIVEAYVAPEESYDDYDDYDDY